MLLLAATSGSHFKASELILWLHIVGEGFPERGCPGEDTGWEQGCTTVGLGATEFSWQHSGRLGELGPLLKLWVLFEQPQASPSHPRGS